MIGVADVVRVSVWKDPNLSTDAVVRPDGTITLPLLGDVVASGYTAAEFERRVAGRLASFAKAPVVTVSIAEVNSYHFTVVGSVEHPGMFAPRYFVSVSDAIALAGGPTRYAHTSSLILVRTVAGHTVRIPIDYDRILLGEAPEQDITVLASDALQVP